MAEKMGVTPKQLEAIKAALNEVGIATYGKRDFDPKADPKLLHKAYTIAGVDISFDDWLAHAWQENCATRLWLTAWGYEAEDEVA